MQTARRERSPVGSTVGSKNTNRYCQALVPTFQQPQPSRVKVRSETGLILQRQWHRLKWVGRPDPPTHTIVYACQSLELSSWSEQSPICQARVIGRVSVAPPSPSRSNEGHWRWFQRNRHICIYFKKFSMYKPNSLTLTLTVNERSRHISRSHRGAV